jgi:DNA-binding response OmpR family regulator
MGGNGTTTGMTQRSLLVVDDEPEIRNFLRLLLEGEGYRVRVARDGLEAADLAGSDPPDLVLTDWAMPHLGGDGLHALLHAGERTREIPIVLMSAVITGATAEYAAFLPKPFELGELLRVIRDCLAERAARNPAEHAPATGNPAETSRDDVAILGRDE